MVSRRKKTGNSRTRTRKSGKTATRGPKKKLPTASKTLKTSKKATPKKVYKPGSKFKKILNKVMKGSLDISEMLIPVVLKAAKNTGYKGAVGTGATALGLLYQSGIAQEAVRMLIDKTREIIDKSEKVLLSETQRDINDFVEVEEEIVFENHYEKPSLQMSHEMKDYPFRGIKKRDIIDRPQTLSTMDRQSKRRRM